jgi:thiamine-phosphate pyrophosphorylase
VIPRLHLVTDDTVLARPAFLDAATEALEVGGGAVALHVRAPGGTGALVFDRCGTLSSVAEKTGSLLLVNDRVDVALAHGLAGVHLGARSLPPEVVRKLLGTDAIIGASVHSQGEAERAKKGGADFLFVGTIYHTPSHPDRPAAGPELIRTVAEGCRLPLLAIGGISADRARRLAVERVHGVAVLRGVWGAASAGGAVRDYLEALGEDR